MRKILFVTAFLLTAPAWSDPHYVQALNPYLGEAHYREYLKTFDEPFSVVTDSVNLDNDDDSPVNGDMYIYIYRINQSGIGKFTLDIYCETGSANLGIAMPFDRVATDTELFWVVNPEEQKKALLVYSTNAPMDRHYYFNDDKSDKKITIGPSCAAAK